MKGKGNAVPLPEVEFNDVSDYYTMYVGIMGTSEDVFWFCDIGFVKTVSANKQAFDKWMNRQMENRNGRKKRS